MLARTTPHVHRRRGHAALFVVGCLLCLPFVALLGVGYVIDTKFSRDCSGWLKLAADANSVPIARERLDRALDYIESNRLTSGSTGVFWDKPTYDIAAWYANLKEAGRNLRDFPAGATEADTSTALVKLRETLLDHGEKGDHVTLPSGIAYYPNNGAWMFASGFSAVAGLVGLFCIAATSESWK